MRAGDLTELAVRNLREAVLRNSLTTLGIGVGVASLVAMLSLGVGLQQLANRKLASSGLFDTVFVYSKQNLRGFGRQGTSNGSSSNAPSNSSGTSSDAPEGASSNPNGTAREARRLDEEARQELEHLPHVVEVYPQVRFPTEVRYAGNPYTTMVAAIPDSARGNGSFDGMQGSFFSSPAADEAILQMEFAKELSDQPSSLIGKELVLRYAERQVLGAQTEGAQASAGDPKTGDSTGNISGDTSATPGISIVPRDKILHIVGIVDTEPAAGFGGLGSGRVLIPIQLGEKLRAAQGNDLRDVLRGPGKKPTYPSLTVRAQSPGQVEAIETAVKNMGFAAFSLLDATRNLRIFFAVFDLLLGIFGSLALAVAMLGIVNTLVMAILERRREIGILKALGAADGDVKQLFFLEAGVMGLLGGALGVGIGWLIGRAVTIGTNIYLRRQSLPATNVFAVPWWLVLGAIVFAVVVSLCAGLYPASRAAKLNPVEALRYE
ncbi:MAG TPA: FtsX-like permease family protein [Terriglobales bacterium]|jgi:putative ABC transport system permease protein|nr:FtsX-like permease family protein [Terriglobales bacterium]